MCFCCSETIAKVTVARVDCRRCRGILLVGRKDDDFVNETMGFSEQGYDIRTIMEQLCGGDGSDDDGGATTGRRPAKLE